jgi:hypothetical protein
VTFQLGQGRGRYLVDGVGFSAPSEIISKSACAFPKTSATARVFSNSDTNR